MPSFTGSPPSVYRVPSPIILLLIPLSVAPSALLVFAILPGHSLYVPEDCGSLRLTEPLFTPSCLHSW